MSQAQDIPSRFEAVLCLSISRKLCQRTCVEWHGYKVGAAERIKGVSLSAGRWNLIAEKNYGVNGARGGARVTLDYRFDFGSYSTHSASSTLAQKMRPAFTDDGRAVLDIAATRPDELPRVFLAKVDATANKAISVLKNCLSQGVVVTPQEAVIPIGASPVINFVKKDNSVISTSPGFSVDGDNLVVRITSLAAPRSVDNYVVDVTDSTGDRYQVFITAETSSTAVCAQ